MRKYVPGLVLFGAVVLVNLVGALAYLTADKFAAANESHLSRFIVAITGVAAAVASAFPIFGRGVPWLAARAQRFWPEQPPEPPTA